MIQVTAQTRVLASVEPIDFRAGIDRLCRICQAHLSSDPFSGTMYVFRNRQASAIKILYYDGQGFLDVPKALVERAISVLAGSHRRQAASAARPRAAGAADGGRPRSDWRGSGVAPGSFATV